MFLSEISVSAATDHSRGLLDAGLTPFNKPHQPHVIQRRESSTHERPGSGKWIDSEGEHSRTTKRHTITMTMSKPRHPCSPWTVKVSTLRFRVPQRKRRIMHAINDDVKTNVIPCPPIRALCVAFWRERFSFRKRLISTCTER